MTLPLSRNTSYPDTIKSADLNDLQDCVIHGKHGPKKLWLPAPIADRNTVTPGADLTPDFTFGRWTWHGNADVIAFPVPLHEGDRITAVDVCGVEGDDAAETFSAKIFERNPVAGGNGTQKSTTKTSSGAGGGARETLSWTAADTDVPLVLAADRTYVVLVQLASSAGGVDDIGIEGIRITYDRP